MNQLDHPQAIRDLVRPDQVHKQLYLSEQLFDLEQRHFFGNTWNYAGHASQIPQAGDYITFDLAGQPLLVLRDHEGAVRVFFNRCAHKGAQLFTSESGNTGGRFLRCPYHAWTYRMDGSLLAYPLKAGYECSGLAGSEASHGLVPVPGLQVYRDFIFVRLSRGGIAFDDYFGPMRSAIDNMVDRSPSGELRVEGGVLRNTIHCNWKFYLENINDPVHPVTVHESAVRAAQAVWQPAVADTPQPMSVEQILPFGAKYEFFHGMGGQVYPNGHSVSGTHFSIHSGYGELGDYARDLEAALGQERARQVLEQSPQNAVLYPSLALKGSPQTIRVIRPVAVDRTVIEAWNFRTVGAPELLLERALAYSRLAFSPMSFVAHDDVHLFESQQRGLRSRGSDWVSLHREFSADEPDQPNQATSGTSEWLIRNQYRAWVRFMTEGMASE
ncbi:MAG: Rieske (2Fe-2S) domain protein [Ramlibacter sp.]|nr:Rieske (2Fe-2S) domain protein [Ramlibacter sp.]